MLTKVTIQNFKKLEHVEFSLSQSVVLIGPNNAGKSTIFQALCLWEVGVREFLEVILDGHIDEDESVSINRKDILFSPIIDTSSLWRDKHVTIGEFVDLEIIKLIITLFGEDEGTAWSCEASFEYINTESVECQIQGNITQLVR